MEKIRVIGGGPHRWDHCDSMPYACKRLGCRAAGIGADERSRS